MFIELASEEYREIESAVKNELWMAINKEYDGQIVNYGSATKRIMGAINRQLKAQNIKIRKGSL